MYPWWKTYKKAVWRKTMTSKQELNNVLFIAKLYIQNIDPVLVLTAGFGFVLSLCWNSISRILGWENLVDRQDRKKTEMLLCFFWFWMKQRYFLDMIRDLLIEFSVLLLVFYLIDILHYFEVIQLWQVKGL